MRSIVIVSAFILAGCQTVFVPAYSEDIHSQLASASEDLQRIQVTLRDTQHHEAADLEPTFVDTLTHLGQASAASNARAQSGGTVFARRSGTIIAANVTRCEVAVRGALQASREGSLDSGAFERLFVFETCNFPKMEEQLLQR
jgi:hypothetical protein